jgi:acylphosphatase
MVPKMGARRLLRFVVMGQVQGVWFRGSTQAEAERLGLAGWVRNLPDGSVDGEAEGEERALGELLAWLHHGPPSARVAVVEADWAEARGEFRGFVVRR